MDFIKGAINALKNIGLTAIVDAIAIPALVIALMYGVARFAPTPVVAFTIPAYLMFVVSFLIVDALMEPIRQYLLNPFLHSFNL